MTSPEVDANTADIADIELSDPLERAAHQVLREYATESGAERGRELLRHEIRAVVEDVRAALSGRALPEAEAGRLDRIRLLRALRTAVLEERAEERAPPLPLMRAFESVQRVLLDNAARASLTEVLNGYSRSLLDEVAHLLRSPLGSMVMLAEVLLDEQSGPLTDVQKRQIRIIHRAVAGMASTVESVLTLTGTGEGPGAPSPLSVPEIVESVADLVRPVAAGRGSELVVELSSVDGRRLGRASAISRALLGAAVPAALRTRDGSLTLRAQGREDDGVSFIVAARGNGAVPDEDLATLLRVPCVDPDSTGCSLSAAGLGLAAARARIHDLGSELVLEATADGAFEARFSLLLPPVIPARDFGLPAAAAARTGPPPPSPFATRLGQEARGRSSPTRRETSSRTI
ncbi:MAG TPA: histidine kinase dimerization/phospho-acceptor domain-containing protein [Longimicrobiales bacterium]|nr:histidine kinase dimerization/phospho-acceptor domain-containing protein [Longimicrobiales bacterium]